MVILLATKISINFLLTFKIYINYENKKGVMSTFWSHQALKRMRQRNRRDDYRERRDDYGEGLERATEEAKEEFKEAIPKFAQDVKNIEAALDNNTGENFAVLHVQLDSIQDQAYIYHDSAYRFDDDKTLTMADILNKGLAEGETPFTPESLNRLSDGLYIAAINQKLFELKDHPRVGGLKNLNKFIESNTPSDVNLQSLSISDRDYSKGYSPTEKYTATYTYDPSLGEILGLSEADFSNIVLTEYNISIATIIEARQTGNRPNFEHNSEHYSAIKLDALINSSSEIMADLDPDLSQEEHRQLLLADYSLSDEVLEEWKQTGGINDINNTLAVWNKKSFECDNTDDFNKAAYDNARRYRYIKAIADRIGLDIKMENKDSIIEAGVDFDALKSFNERHTQLIESANGGMLTKFSRLLGSPNGCTGQALD